MTPTLHYTPKSLSPFGFRVSGFGFAAPLIIHHLCWVLCGLALLTELRADDWPQWLGPQRDGIWRETGIMDTFPAGGPSVMWRTAIGAGFTGPAVANGKVYVADRITKPASDSDAAPVKVERVLCLNEADGKILWQQEYPCSYGQIAYAAGPRVTPNVHLGKVYTLGAVGNLYCWDALTGKIIWSRNLNQDYGLATPIWGYACHPIIEGGKLICLIGGNGTTVMAFDLNTGKEIWRALSARQPGYSPPMVYEAGGKRQLIIWHPEALNSLDAETGKVYWTIPFQAKAALSLATPRKSGDRLFITSFYNGSLMVRLDANQPAATTVWRGKSDSERRTDGLHGLICTPFLDDGHIYGVCSYGQLRCLKMETGERIWETLQATTEKEVRWGTAFIIKNGNRFFLWNEKGDLIIARLTPKGYEEISRAYLLEPLNRDPNRTVLWSHPAFANRRMYARNDKEIICVDLSK